MKFFKVTFALAAVITLAAARPQHQQSVDPSYLQYFSQQGAPQPKSADATPIYENGHQEAEQQYVQQGQQFRLKDSTAEQARQQAPAAYIAPSLRQYQQPQQHQPQAIQYVQPQPQPQPAVYKPAAPKQTLVVRRPQYQAAPQPAAPQRFNKEEEEEEYSEPQSYQFGFDVKDDEFTNYQNRKEVKDGNVIKGSYSVVDSDGFIRTVTYTADPKEGFKAEVVREPTDIVVKFPTPAPQHRLQPHEQGAAGPQHGQPQQHGSQYAQQPQYRPAPKQQQQPQQYQYHQ